MKIELTIVQHALMLNALEVLSKSIERARRKATDEGKIKLVGYYTDELIDIQACVTAFNQQQELPKKG